MFYLFLTGGANKKAEVRERKKVDWVIQFEEQRKEKLVVFRSDVLEQSERSMCIEFC